MRRWFGWYKRTMSLGFRYWLNEYRLRRAVMEAQLHLDHVRRITNPHDHFDEHGEYPLDYEEAFADYMDARSTLVQRAAEWWDVDIPSVIGGDSPWNHHPTRQDGLYLNWQAQREVRRLVRKAKRESIGWHVQNVLNVLGALAGVIGALTGLVAVWK